jgi:hypothetical protein
MLRQRQSGGSKLKRLTYAGLVSAFVSIIGIVPLGVRSTSAATCTNNDIIKCGYSSPTDFINKVKANTNGVNSTPDLQAIYAHYGLSSADYANFAAHAVAGEAMRNGHIVVNGKVVASGAMSIGRDKSFQGTNPFTVTINGQNYFGNTNDQAFAAGVTELPVDVLFNSNGVFQFAVLPSCGNPEIPSAVAPAPPKPTPPPKPAPIPPPAPAPTPAFECKELTASPVNGSTTTFTFVATSQASGGAKFEFANFTFGDGATQTNITPGSDAISTAVTHTYTQSGNFTANAVLFFSVPNSSSMTPVSAPACFASVAPMMPAPPAVTVSTPPAPTPAPQALPNTGAGDVIGLFSAVTALGYFGYRRLILHRNEGD